MTYSPHRWVAPADGKVAPIAPQSPARRKFVTLNIIGQAVPYGWRENHGCVLSGRDHHNPRGRIPMQTTKPGTIVKMISTMLALAMLATACGGGGGDDQELIDAITQAMTDEGDMPEDVDANCLATTMVTSLGGAKVLDEKYGLNVESVANGSDIDDVDLPRDEAISMADGMLECGLIESMINEMAADVSEDAARCVVDKIDQNALRDTFAADFMSEAEGTALAEEAAQTMFGSMLGAFADCDIDPSVMLGS